MNAQTLKDAFLATNPVEPLSGDDSRYVNCDKVRGEKVTTKLKKSLQWSKGTGPLHLVFTGHQGCGKSTELHRLITWISTGRYRFCLFFKL
ncbi:MAG: hypothetical protein QME81_08315, partial [bacterium]|nr:hypothetical protein [bacterium]